MQEKLKSLKGEPLNPLWWKSAVIFLGYFFALVNQVAHPTDLAPLPETTTDQDIASIRIGGFAIITAITLFAGLIPTRTQKPLERLIDGLARFLGVLAAFGAGWYTLDIATEGNPGLYMYGLGILTGFATVALLVWAGIWVVAVFAFSRSVAGIEAAILFLRTVVSFLVNRLRR